MQVEFNVRQFLDRAAFTYPDRVAVVDEPDQPAEPWAPLTFAGLADGARAQAAAYGVPASGSVEQALDHDGVGLVVNLTIPAAHAQVAAAALSAGLFFVAFVKGKSDTQCWFRHPLIACGFWCALLGVWLWLRLNGYRMWW